MAKYKIMFVCLGNICRSPMAEFICKDLVKKAGREAEFEIASSAVSSENVYNGVGAPVYKPAQAELKKHGITCEGKRAQVLKESVGEKYDLFLCMDDSNVRRAKRILGGKNEKKCKKLLSYARDSGDVADPWYTGDFTVAYADILRGVKGLLDSLE